MSAGPAYFNGTQFSCHLNIGMDSLPKAERAVNFLNSSLFLFIFDKATT
jgi:hypothetical protein